MTQVKQESITRYESNHLGHASKVDEELVVRVFADRTGCGWLGVVMDDAVAPDEPHIGIGRSRGEIAAELLTSKNSSELPQEESRT